MNYVVTVIRFRAPGMGYMRMPLTVWGLWLTAILNILFVPVLGAATLLLLLDRVFGTQFFIAGAASVRGGGDPILFQHLFWIFGHPEVYILILPAWGLVGDLVAFFSRKPAYWYRGSVWAMVLITVLSAVVYGHHMFTTGMNPMLGKAFMTLTLIISAPAELLFLNWLHTIWKGSMRAPDPDAVHAGGGVRVRPGRPDRPVPGHHLHRPLPARHHVRGGALPPDHGRGHLPGDLRRHLLLVPQDVRPHAERAAGQVALLADGGARSPWCSAGSCWWATPGSRAAMGSPPVRVPQAPAAGSTCGPATSRSAWRPASCCSCGTSSPTCSASPTPRPTPGRSGTLEWTVPSPPPVHNFDPIPTVAAWAARAVQPRGDQTAWGATGWPRIEVMPPDPERQGSEYRRSAGHGRAKRPPCPARPATARAPRSWA